MSEFIISFVGVFALAWVLTPFSQKIGLVDQPDARKMHEGSVPLIGGIAMFSSCAIASVYFVPHSAEMAFLLVACALLVLTGTLDDHFDLHYYIRIIVQTLATTILIWGANTYLVSFGDLFNLGDLHLGFLGIPVTFIAVIGMINAYNMIDGIDGLSAGLVLISSITLYALIGNKISDGAANILLLLVGALSAYLILNLHLLPRWTSKIFMGDAGSMVLGFIMTAFLIRYTQGEKQVLQPITALWIAGVPLLDIAMTVVRRVRHGKNPFHPDRTHVHHIFMRAGFSKTTTLLLILSFQTLSVVTGVALEYYATAPISLACFILLFLIYMQFIKRAFKAAKFLRTLRKA